MTANTDMRMRHTDFFAWNMEKDPLLRSTVVSVTVLDHEPDWDVLVDRTERATRVVPGFRQRLVPSPLKLAPPRFQLDPHFDVTWHMRRVGAPPPYTLATVFHLARGAGMAAFDPARPLWESTLVTGLEDGRAALIFKVHHSLTDGIGGIQVAARVVDFAPEPAEQGPLPALRESGTSRFGPLGGTPVGALFEALGWDVTHVGVTALERAARIPQDVVGAVRDPVRAVSGLVEDIGSIGRFVRPVLRTRSPIMTERRLGWQFDVIEVGTDALKTAGKAAGGSLNDAFLAGVTGGMRRYHESFGAPVEDLRVAMPISVRKPGDPEGGNRITLVRFTVPVGIEDPVRRMRQINKACRRERDEPAVAFAEAISAVLNILPSAVIGGMLKHVDFLASDVPGFPDPVWIAGAKVVGFYPFGPTIGAAANMTLMSYNGRCGVGVNIDTGAVTDPALFVDCLAAGFAEVLDVGGEHDGVRQVLRERPERSNGAKAPSRANGASTKPRTRASTAPKAKPTKAATRKRSAKVS
jgi:diacylglycerol O-acyltransferase / wax synthase